MATGSEFVTEDEFRWVLGWVIGGAVAILSILSTAVGYMFKRLTDIPCREEVEQLIDGVRKDLKDSQKDLKLELREGLRDMSDEVKAQQVAQHGENSRRLDRIDSDVHQFMERIQRIWDSAPEIIRRAQADIREEQAGINNRLKRLESEK